MTTILLVEDDQDLQFNIKNFLELQDYDVLIANNGYEGVEMATVHLPDLVISDIMMPGLNGYEMLEILRRNMQTSLIPVIFLTAKSQDVDRRRGMLLGSDDYITKPFKEEDVLEAVESRLKLRTTREIHRLRMIASDLVELQERDRRRIAHQLQDAIFDQLSGLKIGLNTLSIDQPIATKKAALESIQELLGQVSASIETTAFELYPVMIEQLGLVPSLFWQLDISRRQFNHNIVFEHQNLPRNLPENVNIAIYRIVQETLAQISEAPEPCDTGIQIWQEQEIIHIQITMDHKIFDLAQHNRQGSNNSIWRLRERAIAVGGDLTFIRQENEARSMLYVQLPAQEESVNNTISEQFSDILSQNSDRLTREANEQLANDAISIALVLENELVSAGLSTIITQSNQQRVKGVARSYDAGLNLILDLNPDVVITDLRISDNSTFEFIGTVKQNTNCSVIVISSITQEIYVVEALECGADGYILFDTSPDEIHTAINTVLNAQTYLSSAISLEKIREIQSGESSILPLSKYRSLSEREKEVFELVAEGYSNADIAEKLVISRRTVESHRASVISKLGLRNKVDLLRYAVELGIIQLRES